MFQLLQPDQFAVREHFFVLVCYEANSLSFFWRILLFIYLGILQLLGIVLSFQTRRVKYTGLRDSKYITAIIYISSIVLAILALVTFSLRTYMNIGTGIFVSGYFILTTIFLSLIFIPKVIMSAHNYSNNDYHTILICYYLLKNSLCLPMMCALHVTAACTAVE